MEKLWVPSRGILSLLHLHKGEPRTSKLLLSGLNSGEHQFLRICMQSLGPFSVSFFMHVIFKSEPKPVLWSEQELGWSSVSIINHWEDASLCAGATPADDSWAPAEEFNQEKISQIHGVYCPHFRAGKNHYCPKVNLCNATRLPGASSPLFWGCTNHSRGPINTI